MARKVLAVAACVFAAFYALAVVNLGVDRLNRSGTAATMRPIAPFAANTHLADARAALRSGDAANAAAAAAKALRKMPMSAEPPALLGAIALQSGDAERAQAAFEVAAQGGWRNRPTQLYWMAAALQRGEAGPAALRVDALLRTGDRSEGTRAGLAQLEATEAGRAALGVQMRDNPPWLSDILADAGALPPAAFANRLSVFESARTAYDLPIACQPARSRINTMFYTAQRHAEAYRLYRAACGSGKTRFVQNHQFVRPFASGGTPFDWKVSAKPQTYAVIGNGRLELGNDSGRAVELVSQAVLLPKGAIVVRLRGAGSSTLRAQDYVTLSCLSKPLPAIDLAGTADPGIVGYTVPESCNHQLLAIRAPATARLVEIESIDIGPLDPSRR